MPSLASAQRTIGIIWQAPPSKMDAASQLHYFSEAGFSYLQIEGELSPSTWKLINRLGFNVYAMLPVRFPVKEMFSKADSAFYQKIERLSADYGAQPSVRAIGLFAFGQVTNSGFRKGAADFLKKISSVSSKKFYYVTSEAHSSPLDTLFNFKIRSFSGTATAGNPKVKAFVYRPPDGKAWKLSSVKQFMRMTARSPGIPVFFQSSWLMDMSQKYPRFQNILSRYATTSSAVFPLPKSEEPGFANKNIIVISLLLAWILFGIAWHSDPLYQKSFSRFFRAHSFFVEDVINRDIRTLFSGISILLQHIVSGGIITYCIFETAFSELGQQALAWHLPAWFIFGTGKLGVFFWGLAAVLIIEGISLLVLLTANPRTSHFSQVANIYCWPLQLNLFTATLVAAFFLNGKQAIPTYAAGIVFLLIFFGSFAISVKDIARYLHKGRFWIFSSAAAAYFIVLLGIIGWILFSTPAPQIVHLAASLS